jgi:PAS domain S-box-containing protein
MTFPNNQRVTIDSDIDFQSYTELPNNSPLVIVDLDLKIVFANDAFRTAFSLEVGNDISSMNTNPEFVYLVRGFHESHYKNISVDITLANENDNFIKNYFVRIERVVIKANQYFVLAIESLEQRNKLESKITSLHNALDQGKLPLMILDSNHKITYASRSFEIVLTRELENLFGIDFLGIAATFLETKELEELNAALIQKKTWKKLICFQKKYPMEYWEFSLNPVFDDERASLNFILIASNLTEHVNQTRQIERSEKKQKLIIDNISDLLLIVERVNGAALFENANDNFCKIFNLEKERIYSFKIEDFIPQALSDEIYNSIHRLIANSSSFQEFHYRHVDNREYSCKITTISERGKNSSYYIITMKDITDEIIYREQLKRAYHKEMQLNKMKSDFLANMSHEIRTPFNAVVGFSEIIEESIETGEVESLQELMGSMKEVLGRALNLFTNIIEVSQIEAGEIELDKVDLNCNHVIRNIYQKSLPEVSKRKLEFVIDLVEEDCLIEVDWVKFERVMFSLIDNAVKYTNEGYIYVGTKIMHNVVEIIISDTGVGIEQSQVERILKPFTQEIEGYTRPFEGAGLGLTLAYKLTLIMGGKFDIISEKNKGTKIIIAFPLSMV